MRILTVGLFTHLNVLSISELVPQANLKKTNKLIHLVDAHVQLAL